VRYNDKSVLENHHIAASFSVIQRVEYNIFSMIPAADLKIIRELMIECVLATDMARHAPDFQKFKNRI
jgi:hypothetical protein